MKSQEPTRQQVEIWLTAVHGEIEELDERLAPLLEERRRLEARLGLLKDLLSSFGPPSLNGEGSTGLRAAGNGSIGDVVREQAEEILRDAGGPLHINEIHRRFLERGFAVPGAGKPVNLTAHVRHSQTIVSPARGTYGLIEHVGSAASRRRTSKRRKGGQRRKTSTKRR